MRRMKDGGWIKKEGCPNRGKVTQAEVKGVGLPSKRGSWLLRGGIQPGIPVWGGCWARQNQAPGVVEVILGWPYGP